MVGGLLVCICARWRGGGFLSFSQLTIYSCEVAFVFLGGVLWAVVANIFWGREAVGSSCTSLELKLFDVLFAVPVILGMCSRAGPVNDRPWCETTISHSRPLGTTG